MVFVVDDVMIAAIVAAVAAAGTGAGLMSSDGKTVITNNRGTKFVKDGAIKGVDPDGTLGHDLKGFPVDGVGRRIASDSSIFERMNLSSYDIVNLGRTIQNSIPQLIGTTTSKSPLVSSDTIPNIKDLVKKLQGDPTFTKNLVETAFKPLEGMNPEDVKKTFIDHPEDIVDIITRDDNNRQKILDSIKPIDPRYELISHNHYKPLATDDIRPIDPYTFVPLDEQGVGPAKPKPIPIPGGPDTGSKPIPGDIQKFLDEIKKLQDAIAKASGSTTATDSKTDSATDSKTDSATDSKTDFPFQMINLNLNLKTTKKNHQFQILKHQSTNHLLTNQLKKKK